MTCMQMVLPLDVNSLLSNSLNVHSHNGQLLEMASTGTAIVIPAWETTVPGTAGLEIATDVVQGKYPMLCYLPTCAVHYSCVTVAVAPYGSRISCCGRTACLPLSWTQSYPHVHFEHSLVAALKQRLLKTSPCSGWLLLLAGFAANLCVAQ